MLISEIEYKLGLTKKSIRYYETEGLLKPKRNINNDYREYDEEDLNNLQKIKFLRQLNVSINDIKRLQQKELTLTECLKDRIKKIEVLEQDFSKIKTICLDIINSNSEYDNMNIVNYLEKMNVIGKKEFLVKDIEKNDNLKILGASLSSLLFGLFFFILMVIITVGWLTGKSNIPILLYLFIMLILGLPLIAIIINLINRIKEIKGGEENEACKY